MAREYLVARASQLGLSKADASDLRVVGTRVGEASTTVAFEQTYQGLPVWGSDTAVSMNRQNLVTFVMNGTKAVSLPDVTPTIAMADARARVLAPPAAAGLAAARPPRPRRLPREGRVAARVALPHGPDAGADRGLGGARRRQDG